MTLPAFEVRALGPDDAAAFVKLRRQALESEPLAFAASPEDDVGLSLEFVRRSLQQPTQAIFGAFAPDLVGVVGVARERKLKAAHKANVWGLFVAARARGQGVGRALVEAAIAFARSLPGVSHAHLSVSERAPEAASLYQSLGFVSWGIEPAALRAGSETVRENHMVLEL